MRHLQISSRIHREKPLGSEQLPYFLFENDGIKYPFKKPGEISEVCVEQENALDSNFGNFPKY
jgi:hypothetical protein